MVDREQKATVSIFKIEKVDSSNSRELDINSRHDSQEILKTMECEHSKCKVSLPTSSCYFLLVLIRLLDIYSAESGNAFQQGI